MRRCCRLSHSFPATVPMHLSDDLLRTMAAVPVDSSVLDLGCGRGRHTEALLRLGFPVHACDPRPGAVARTRSLVADLIDEETAERCVGEATLDAFDYPAETFDWVIADRAEVYASTKAELRRVLTVSRRVLKPGGWVYVTLPASEVDLEDAERTEGDGAPVDAPAAEAGPFALDSLDARRREADLEVAKEPEVVEEAGGRRVHAIYRKVHSHR